MRATSPQWVLPVPATPEVTAALSEALALHPLVADILARRGLETPEAARRFLQPSLTDLNDPFALLGMEEAVERLGRALENGEKILVSGDYDVDGVTSSAMLVEFLRAAGSAEADFFIPNRFEHGYGLTPQTVEALLERRPTLVITVDNGISALAEVESLHAAGIETIVTDHHLPPSEGVPTGIVINPLQPGCPYPFKRICGCGVTFKLITALRKRLREKQWWDSARPEPNLKDQLDLVAIGTVADLVPLVEENRVLVHHGLKILNRLPRRPGIEALLSVSRVNRAVTARTVGFQIAPRINAAGRMSEGSLGVELLLERSAPRAGELALRLDAENQSRRAKGEEMFLEATARIEAEGSASQPALVVASPLFHEGISGIVASRLTERYFRPALVLAENGDSYKGSARSVPGLNVTEALADCADLLEGFGGHAGAAGCRLAKARLEVFRERFLAACARRREETAAPQRHLEGRLRPADCTESLVEQVALLEPFGQSNEEPLFLFDGSELERPPQVIAERHLKWTLESGAELVAWASAGKLEPSPELRLAVKVGFNEYRGRRKIQLTVEDYRTGLE